MPEDGPSHLHDPRGSARPPLQKNDSAIHDSVEPSWRVLLIKRFELSVKYFQYSVALRQIPLRPYLRNISVRPSATFVLVAADSLPRRFTMRVLSTVLI